MTDRTTAWGTNAAPGEILDILGKPTAKSGPPQQGDGPPSRTVAYLAFSRTSTRRQRLVALVGRVSIRRTRSPMPAVSFSS